MMLRCEHEIALSADDFWALIHAPHYEAAVARAAGLGAYRELERREDADAIYRRLRVEAELPPAMRALVEKLGFGVPSGYTEEQWRSRARREVRWRMTPDLLGDRAHVEGVVRVEPHGAGRCLRVLDGVVQVKLFGVGALLERAAVKLVVDAYAKGAELAPSLAPPAH
jgi:hypothetical protein